MSEYERFIASKALKEVPTGHDPIHIPDRLFGFQRAIVSWALQRGRAAIFADTGLGKTAMQVSWAADVCRATGGNVLILAPLCVAQQTVEEAARFDIDVRYCRSQDNVQDGITITNYEMVERFDIDSFVGIVLDESSILKSHDSKTRAWLTAACQSVPYRLSCTATPSPNDHMELGNQSEFLGVMSASEMLAMFFTHDGGDTAKWRLKGHGKTRFWEWMATWSVCIRNPSDLGFDGDGYILPALHINEVQVEATYKPEDQLFAVVAQSLTERRQAKRSTLAERVHAAAEIANATDEHVIVWCYLNDESSELAKAIPDSVEVFGSLSADEKERRIMQFTHGEKRVLVVKPSIAGFGMNWQHCRNMIFVGLDDSFESYYQAVRRCYRFGQKREVNVWIITSESEGAIKANIERKQAQAIEMSENMTAHMREFTKAIIGAQTVDRTEYTRDVHNGEGYTIHLGDCVDVAREIESNTVGYTIFSPPFASLYTYSNSDRDMGNCKDYSEFYGQFRFLVDELLRITMPGRLLSFHCMNLQTSKFRDGVIGLHDFRGELIRMFVDAGWIYHSEVCIWKDPVTAMQRTKALGLLHKTIRKDSSMSRQGIPDYLVTMRKPGDNPVPVSHTHESFPVDLWQKYASPVWFDVNPSRTLQFKTARENDDERHICPLQLDVIERGINLWSAPNDLVFSPFTGIGSEGYVAVQMGRRFVGSELKRSYWELACKNIASARSDQGDMFATSEPDDVES